MPAESTEDPNTTTISSKVECHEDHEGCGHQLQFSMGHVEDAERRLGERPRVRVELRVTPHAQSEAIDEVALSASFDAQGLLETLSKVIVLYGSPAGLGEGHQLVLDSALVLLKMHARRRDELEADLAGVCRRLGQAEGELKQLTAVPTSAALPFAVDVLMHEKGKPGGGRWQRVGLCKNKELAELIAEPYRVHYAVHFVTPDGVEYRPAQGADKED